MTADVNVYDGIRFWDAYGVTDLQTHPAGWSVVPEMDTAIVEFKVYGEG